MNPMEMAKKQVLKDLIREMQARMVATGESPEPSEEGLEAAEEGAEESYEEGAEASAPCEGCDVENCACNKAKPKGMTITLASIKKGPKPAGKMPAALESAIMGGSPGKNTKFKKEY